MIKTIVLGDNYIGTAFKDIYEVWDHRLLQDSDTTEWRNLLTGVNHIIFTLDDKSGSVENIWDENYELLYNLIQFGKKFNIKIIFISTADLYGNNWEWETQTTEESHHLDMNTDYRLMKRVAERLLDKSNAIILRVKNPFDSRPQHENIIYKSISKDDADVWQDSYTYLPDLVKATKMLIDNKHHGIFNIVQPQSASLAYLLKAVLNLPKFAHIELSYDTIINPVEDNLDVDIVRADVNATKIQTLIELTPLDAAVSLSWVGMQKSIDKDR